MKIEFNTVKDNYTTLWSTAIITTNPDSNVDIIIKNRAHYEAVGIIPWDVLGCIHMLESSFSFSRHLHNGDPLTARTVQVPSGRPVNGTPPFTWEYSAQDALQDHPKPPNWSIEGKLWFLESYNGWGYRQYRHINSPYLWSYTNQYLSGKYVTDGQWDPNAVSKQCGAAAVLKRLEERGVVTHSTSFVPTAHDVQDVTSGLPKPNITVDDLVKPQPKKEEPKPISFGDLIASFLSMFSK